MTGTTLNVAIVTTEVVPYSKVGGLADVMGALPDELEKIGVQVSIFTPLYASIDRSKFGIAPAPGMKRLAVQVDGAPVPFRIFTARKPGTGVQVYFVDNKRFYDRPGIYTVPETGDAFEDEDERTVFFNRAVIAAIKEAGLEPDVVHCNDFHTALIPAYLEMEEGDTPAFKGTGTVFSVHNVAYQGIFARDFMRKAGFAEALFRPMSPFEYWGKVNAMKIGLSFAGIISTVSETYAEEIASSEEFGYGLEGILRSRREDLVGILNGIDPVVWNPETDPLIPHRFSAKDITGKRKCREALLEEFGLPPADGSPVIGMVSRLVDQKGFDILAEAMDGIMKHDLRLVVLGTGQQKYHELYSDLTQVHPERFGLRLEFDNRLAHLIEAGSDLFLMPSRYEPCGLNQLYSLRYGTLPIVRATGGLRDTINELTPRGAKGNGFTFDDYSAEALTGAIERAVKFFAKTALFEKAAGRVMSEDHSWGRSAKEYVRMYKRARGRIGMRLTR